MQETDLLEKESVREELINNVSVLEKVKDLLLGDSEFATTQQVADYYEVGLEAVNSIVKRHKEELIHNGYKLYTGKEIKDIFIKFNKDVISYHGGFKIYDQKFANRSNGLFNKRAILNVGMLLRDGKIAREVRSRLLDIEYESNNATQDNGKTVKENIINEIDEEKDLMLQRVEAEINGDYDKVSIINAKLFALKNKRIKDLEDTVDNITTHSLTLTESRQVINKIIKLRSDEYGLCKI